MNRRPLRQRIVDLWIVGKSEPIIRWCVIAAAAGCLLWVGWITATLSLRAYSFFNWEWRHREYRETPRPMTVFALGSDCIKFAGLPSGWSAPPQQLDGSSFSIRGEVDGIDVAASLSVRGGRPLSFDEAALIGQERAGQNLQVPAFTAWRGDDGEFFYADGDQEHYGRAMLCYNKATRILRRTYSSCAATDRRFPGKYDVSVNFPWEAADKANRLIDASEAALKTVFTPCAQSRVENETSSAP